MMRTSNTRDGNTKELEIARYKKLIRSPIKLSSKINTLNTTGKATTDNRNMSSKSTKIKYTLSKNSRAKSFSMSKQLSKSNSNKFNNFSKLSSKIKSEDYVYKKYRPKSKVTNENLSNSTTMKNNYLKKSRYNSADQYKMNYIGKDNNLDKFFQSKDIIAKSHNFKKEFDIKKNKFNIDKKDYIPLDFYFPPQQINININNYNFSNYNNNNNSKVNNSQKLNYNFSKNEISKPFSNNSELLNSNIYPKGIRPMTKNEINRNFKKPENINVNLDRLYNSNSNSNFSASLANSYVNSGGQNFNSNNKIFSNNNNKINDSEFNNLIDIKESNDYKEFRNNVVLNNHKFTEINLIQDIENNREKSKNYNDKIKISKVFQQKIKDINNVKDSKNSFKNNQIFKSNENNKFGNSMKFSEKIEKPLNENVEKLQKPFEGKKIEKFENREISGYMSSKQEKRPEKKMDKISFKEQKNVSKDTKETKIQNKNSQKLNDQIINDNLNFADEEESFYNDVYFFMEESDKISGKKLFGKDTKNNKYESNKEMNNNNKIESIKEVKEIGIGSSGMMNSDRNKIGNYINNNQTRLKTPFEFQGVRQSKLKNVVEKNEKNVFKDEILEENVRNFLTKVTSTRT